MALGKDLPKAVEQAKRLNEAVARAKRGKPAAPAPGSIAAVIRSYKTGEHYKALAPATQTIYTHVLSEIEKVAGDLAADSVTRKDLKITYAALQKRGLRIAQEHMKLWRIILGHAYDTGLRDDNPALALKIKQPKARRQLWTFDDVMVFCGTALEAGSKSMFIAVMLAYALGQRVGDVRLLHRSAWDGQVFWIRQKKTDQLVAVDTELWVRRFIEKLPKTGLMFVLNENTGKPYTMTNFSHVFAKLRDRAGLAPDLQFRDLRRTALTEANAGGATTGDMQGLGGHQSREMLSTYAVPTPESSSRAQRSRNEGRAKVAKLAEIGWQKPKSNGR
jgi:integrase